jgi:hypothetical protein
MATSSFRYGWVLASVALLCPLAMFVPSAAGTGNPDIKLKAQVPQAAPLPSCRSKKAARLEGKAEIRRAVSNFELRQAASRLRSKVTQDELMLKAIYPLMAVDRSVPLKGKLTELADGTKLAALKDDGLFERDLKRLVQETATVDLSDAYVQRTVYKAFVQMDCLEFAALGANYYTAPDFYKSFQYGGRNIIIGASDNLKSPVLKLTIAGHIYEVTMELPGLNRSSHNVVVVTDGQHVLCIDPRTYDTWKLLLSFTNSQTKLSWLKLEHTRGKCIELIKTSWASTK